MVAPLACLAAVYFLLNSGLTAEAVALSKGYRRPRFWRQHFVVMSLNYLAAASAAYLFVLLVQQVGAAAVAVVVPLILVCHLAMRSWLGRVDDAQRHLARVNELYLSTISAFSTAIEAKDGVTSDHIHRVKAYAMGLAAGARHAGSLDAAGDRSRRAAARHRQAGDSRAHPQQAGKADGARVRDR